MIEAARRNSIRTGAILGGAGILLLLAMVWGNLSFARANPGGKDFLVHWMSTRLLLTQGIDPYSDDAASEMREYAEMKIVPISGISRIEPSELRLVSPLYSMVLFLPFIFSSDFALSRALWMTILEVAIIVQAIFTIRIVSWKPKWPITAGLLLIFLVWYPTIQSIVDGDLIILVGLFIVGGLLALRSKTDEIAGVLFALTTIKIHSVLLLLIFVLYWSYRQGRWRLIGWFIGTLLLLSLSVALIMPSWVISNLRSVVAFFSQNPSFFMGDILSGELPASGNRIGWILFGVMIVVLLVEWWMARRKEFRLFLWMVCLTLVISQWVGVRLHAGNFVLLFPTIALVFTLLIERWRRGGSIVGGFGLLILTAGIWLLYSDRGGQIAHSSLLIFPIPALLIVMLYWVRWWIVRSYDLGFESAYTDEDTEIL